MSQPSGCPSPLQRIDPEIAGAVAAEDERQQSHLELIASENYCPAAVMEAAASSLTDKYAEGYPGRRWYGGCENADKVERLAIERAMELFGAEHANVQPHAGSQANMAVYVAAMKPGDTVLGMSLSQGGHLTHGHHANCSAQFYTTVHYGVDADGRIDYDEVRRLAVERRPRLIIAGASAYSRMIDFERFRRIADEAGSYLMADMAHIAGLVAGGVHPSPVPHADFVTSTTHKTLRGPRGAFILCRGEHAQAVDHAVFPGTQGGALMHVIAAKAVAFKLAMQPEFRTYARQIVANAAAMAELLTGRGYSIVSGGTDNHLFLIDLTGRGINGRDACALLGRAHITVNKNAIPDDPLPPAQTSGIRIGTPAMTSRGMKEEEARAVAQWIADILDAEDRAEAARAVREHVSALCTRFPVLR